MKKRIGDTGRQPLHMRDYIVGGFTSFWMIAQKLIVQVSIPETRGILFFSDGWRYQSKPTRAIMDYAATSKEGFDSVTRTLSSSLQACKTRFLDKLAPKSKGITLGLVESHGVDRTILAQARTQLSQGLPLNSTILQLHAMP